MVRLLHFRKLGCGSVAEILPARQRHVRLHRLSRHVCRGFFGPAIWSHFLWANWRPDRAQVCVPGYAVSDGLVHGGDWLNADIQDGRMDRTDRNPRAARAGPRRRVWRSGRVCGRILARRQARILHELHTDHGNSGIVRFADRNSADSIAHEQRRIFGLGLADSVPDLDRAGGDFVVYPAEAEGVANLRVDEECGTDVASAAQRRIHEVAEPKAGADHAFWSNGRARRGVVYGAVLCTVLYADDSKSEPANGKHRDRVCAGGIDAVLRGFWRAFGQDRTEESHAGRLLDRSADIHSDLSRDGARCGE